jgi:hypothetical protein
MRNKDDLNVLRNIISFFFAEDLAFLSPQLRIYVVERKATITRHATGSGRDELIER